MDMFPKNRFLGSLAAFTGMNAMRRFSTKRAIFPTASVGLLLGVYITVSTIVMVIQCWAPYPIGDQWDELVSTRTVSWFWLISQHNEHRLLIPRLIFWADRWLTNERNGFEFVMNVVSQVALTAIMVKLARSFLPQTLPGMLWPIGLVTSFLFWSIQYENFAWGFQIQFFGVNLAAVATFVIVALGIQSIQGAIWAAAAGAIAVYTLASGILVPFLAFGLALWIRRPVSHLAILGAAAIILPVTYMIGYQTPVESSDPFRLFSHFQGFAGYFLAEIGGPFAAMGQQLFPRDAQMIGVVGLVLFGLLAAHIRRRSPTRHEMVLFTTCCFVLGAVGLTAMGRVRFGLVQALSSRYATPVLLFWLALVLLAAARFRHPGRMPTAIVFISIPLMAWIAISESRFVDLALHIAKQRSVSVPALLANVNDPRIASIYGDPAVPMRARGAILLAGTSIFADSWSNWLGSPVSDHLAVSIVPVCAGVYLEAEPLDAGRSEWRAAGRAWDTASMTALRRIILADKDGQIVGYGLGGYDPVIINQFHRNAGAPATDWWTGNFRSADPETVAAYAVGDDGWTACALQRAGKVEPPPAILASPLPGHRIDPGGFIDVINWAPKHVSIGGWGMLTDDGGQVLIDTNLPVKAMIMTPGSRPDVATALGIASLRDSGLTIEIDLSAGVESADEVRLCVWTRDARYGEKVL